MPQTRGMTWSIWLQVESSMHSWRARRQPRLELVGVGENIPNNSNDIFIYRQESGYMVIPEYSYGT